MRQDGDTGISRECSEVQRRTAPVCCYAAQTAVGGANCKPPLESKKSLLFPGQGGFWAVGVDHQTEKRSLVSKL